MPRRTAEAGVPPWNEEVGEVGGAVASMPRRTAEAGVPTWIAKFVPVVSCKVVLLSVWSGRGRGEPTGRGDSLRRTAAAEYSNFLSK